MLRNRVVMAPMTRCRVAAPAYAPGALTATYYAQRASAGLIVSEGIVVSEQARGYCNTPGLYNDLQQQAWKAVTQAVHVRGGRIFAQLWHCGRISHTGVLPVGCSPVGPSDECANSMTFVAGNGGVPSLLPCSLPRALRTGELRGVAASFAEAARRAIAAGFDGVEIHAANGYLLDQFRCPFLNQRKDRYGGSLENRCRLLVETAQAVAAAVGPSRTGVRLSPWGRANDMRADPEPLLTYPYLARQFDQLGLTYLHLNDQDGSWVHRPDHPLLHELRGHFAQSLILCGGFDGKSAEAALRANSGDLIAFGRPYISNPDLAERLGNDQDLAPYDHRTFYSGGARGYTDYPRHAAVPVEAGPHASRTRKPGAASI